MESKTRAATIAAAQARLRRKQESMAEELRGYGWVVSAPGVGEYSPEPDATDRIVAAIRAVAHREPGDSPRAPGGLEGLTVALCGYAGGWNLDHGGALGRLAAAIENLTEAVTGSDE